MIETQEGRGTVVKRVVDGQRTPREAEGGLRIAGSEIGVRGSGIDAGEFRSQGPCKASGRFGLEGESLAGLGKVSVRRPEARQFGKQIDLLGRRQPRRADCLFQRCETGFGIAAFDFRGRQRDDQRVDFSGGNAGKDQPKRASDQMPTGDAHWAQRKHGLRSPQSKKPNAPCP
ncbi:MAG: hypothetical protein WD099_06685, partial [Dongiaceae bacterium]